MLKQAAVAMIALNTTAQATEALKKINHIVIIYGENHSFDQLFGEFPGADGILHLSPSAYLQRDRDGTLMKTLPPVWGGVIDAHLLGNTAAPITQIPESATRDLPNHPFAINDPKKWNLPPSIATRDLYHRFYESQMQIDGGKNDKFAAWSDAGGLTMGYYSANQGKTEHPLYTLAKSAVLADHYFQGSFGGSYSNHQYLICACANTLTPAQQTRPKISGPGMVKVDISAVEPDGVTLLVKGPSSALTDPPEKMFVASKNLTPLDPVTHVYYAINTMQPPYPPSGYGVGADKKLTSYPQVAVDLDQKNVLLPQTMPTIGDRLSDAHVSWVWYAGAMQYAIDHGVYNGAAGRDAHGNLKPSFQAHHNPFNYYAAYAPGTPARAEHLKDGGLNGDIFIKDIDAGKLPAVTFYKPQGNLTGHPGYSDITSSDAHVLEIIDHLKKSPQWKDMLVIVTYDEFGGQWDHVAPPKADRFGPGPRVPAIILSPLAKKGIVDHTPYDTGSIQRLLNHRFSLKPLPGILVRDQALQSNDEKPLGDFTAALK